MIDITISPYLQSLTAGLQNDSTYFRVFWIDYLWFTLNLIRFIMKWQVFILFAMHLNFFSNTENK